MSKVSFRARPPDQNKPLPVLRSHEVNNYHGAVFANRTVPTMPTGMEKEEETETHLVEALSAQQTHGTTGQSTIPVPEIVDIPQAQQDSLYVSNFKQPKQYIHIQALGLEYDIPDYDMDSEDETWISTNKTHFELKAIDFERMMDRLEKNSGQQIIQLEEAKCLLKIDDEFTQTIYNYWRHKRLRCGVPLIPQVRQERPGVPGSGSNPYVAFRRRSEKMQTRKNRKNDENSYIKMIKMRQEMNKALTILGLIRRREKWKKELVQLSLELLEKRFQLRDFDGSLLGKATSGRRAAGERRPRFSSGAGEEPFAPVRAWLNRQPAHAPPEGITVRKRSVDRPPGTYQRKRKAKALAAFAPPHAPAPDVPRIPRGPGFAAHRRSSSAVLEQDADSAVVDERGDRVLEMADVSADEPYAFRRKEGCHYCAPVGRQVPEVRLTNRGQAVDATPQNNAAGAHLRSPPDAACHLFSVATLPAAWVPHSSLVTSSTSARHPGCCGLIRRRVGRGGRIIFDRTPALPFMQRLLPSGADADSHLRQLAMCHCTDKSLAASAVLPSQHFTDGVSGRWSPSDNQSVIDLDVSLESPGALRQFVDQLDGSALAKMLEEGFPQQLTELQSRGLSVNQRATRDDSVNGGSQSEPSAHLMCHFLPNSARSNKPPEQSTSSTSADCPLASVEDRALQGNEFASESSVASLRVAVAPPAPPQTSDHAYFSHSPNKPHLQQAASAVRRLSEQSAVSKSTALTADMTQTTSSPAKAPPLSGADPSAQVISEGVVTIKSELAFRPDNEEQRTGAKLAVLHFDDLYTQPSTKTQADWLSPDRRLTWAKLQSLLLSDADELVGYNDILLAVGVGDCAAPEKTAGPFQQPPGATSLSLNHRPDDSAASPQCPLNGAAAPLLPLQQPASAVRVRPSQPAGSAFASKPLDRRSQPLPPGHNDLVFRNATPSRFVSTAVSAIQRLLSATGVVRKRLPASYLTGSSNCLTNDIVDNEVVEHSMPSWNKSSGLKRVKQEPTVIEWQESCGNGHELKQREVANGGDWASAHGGTESPAAAVEALLMLQSHSPVKDRLPSGSAELAVLKHQLLQEPFDSLQRRSQLNSHDGVFEHDARIISKGGLAQRTASGVDLDGNSFTDGLQSMAMLTQRNGPLSVVVAGSPPLPSPDPALHSPFPTPITTTVAMASIDALQLPPRCLTSVDTPPNGKPA